MKMKTRLSLPLALTFVLTSALRAAPPAPEASDPFLAQLEGDWELAGTVTGKAVVYHGEGRWVLKKGWLCLTLLDTAKPPGYEASVYIGADRKEGDYIAHWLDQFGAGGARVVGSGHREGQKLVLIFPYADGDFRDTFVLAADGHSGSLLMESQEKDGSWSTFGSWTMTRSAPEAQGRGRLRARAELTHAPAVRIASARSSTPAENKCSSGNSPTSAYFSPSSSRTRSCSVSS